MTCAQLRTKTQISLSRKNNMPNCTYVCKVGIANSLCSRTVKFTIVQGNMRLCSRITWSSKLFHCNSYLLSVPINFAFFCDTTFPLCSRFYGIPVKFTFSLAARSSEERTLAARGLVSVTRDSTCFVRLTWVKDSGLGLELNEMSVKRILLIWSMKKMLLICENQHSNSIL